MSTVTVQNGSVTPRLVLDKDFLGTGFNEMLHNPFKGCQYE